MRRLFSTLHRSDHYQAACHPSSDSALPQYTYHSNSTLLHTLPLYFFLLQNIDPLSLRVHHCPTRSQQQPVRAAKLLPHRSVGKRIPASQWHQSGRAALCSRPTSSALQYLQTTARLSVHRHAAPFCHCTAPPAHMHPETTISSTQPTTRERSEAHPTLSPTPRCHRARWPPQRRSSAP